MCEGGSALRADPGFTIYKIPVADYRPWFHNFPDFHPKVGIRRVMKPGKGGSDPELLMQESFIRRMWSLPVSVQAIMSCASRMDRKCFVFL